MGYEVHFGKIKGQPHVPGQEGETYLDGSPTYNNGYGDKYAMLTQGADGQFHVREYDFSPVRDRMGADRYDPDILSITSSASFDNEEQARSKLDEIKDDYNEKYEAAIVEGIKKSKQKSDWNRGPSSLVFGSRSPVYNQFMRMACVTIAKDTAKKLLSGGFGDAARHLSSEPGNARRFIGSSFAPIIKISEQPLHLSQEMHPVTQAVFRRAMDEVWGRPEA